MTAHVLKTRGMLLRDMGKAGMAVLVLGTAACASEAADDGDTTPTSADNGTPGTAQPSSTSSTSASPTTQAASSGSSFHRVDLGFVSAYILYRDGEAALVDTGVPGSDGSIGSALAEIGLGWGAVGHVIVTHKHPDHQGSLQSVISQAPDAPWYAGSGDIAAITADSEGVVVGDGESIFDLQIIETPGHTPGHLSVLDPAASILVSGDALNGAEGGVIGANPDFSEDMQLANASIERLAGFDYDVVLFGHGEPILRGGSEAVAALAATLG